MLDTVRGLALEAGQEILKIYRSGEWTVFAKGDESPLTQADLAANAILVPGLQKLTPDTPVVSEESDPTSIQVGRSFWLVDPLDGTRDFVARLDTFVVCVSLVEEGYPVFGLIHSPVLGRTWWAQRGQGAFADGRRIQNTSKRTSLIAAGSRTMPSERMQMFYNHFSIQEVQRYGSALKFCRLAEGEVDLYPRFGPTNEWDTAAGQIIAEEAGCKVIEIASGERLRYGKPAFHNSDGFMASRLDLDLVGPLNEAGFTRKK